MNLTRMLKICSPLLLAPFLMGNDGGCERDTSDDVQRRQQEQMLQEGTSQVGMPAIKNFRERKILKDIIELRDQNGLVTYTYVENLIPTVVSGQTALGGKFTFFCNSIGYPISSAMQFTNPQKLAWPGYHESAVIPQADPNGLFSPSAAEGTWVMCKDPGGDKVAPVYSEPKLVGSPFKFKVD